MLGPLSGTASSSSVEQRVLDQRLSPRVVAFAWRRRAGARAPSDISPARSCWPAASLRCELVAPGAEHVGPRLDVVLPAPDPVELELAGPADAVRDGRRSGASRPRASRRSPAAAVADDRRRMLVAVAEDVGGDRRPCRRRSAWPGSGRRRPPASGTGSRSGLGARLGRARAAGLSRGSAAPGATLRASRGPWDRVCPVRQNVRPRDGLNPLAKVCALPQHPGYAVTNPCHVR